MIEASATNQVDPPSDTETDPPCHPLGPILTRVEYVGRGGRAVAGVILFASAAIVGLSIWLEPDAAGHGTHRQLGLSGCPLPMLTGYPCPSCGMTTAFSHTVRGQLVAALIAQPAGLLMALGTIAAGFLSGFTLATGRSWRINWYRISPNRVAFGVTGVILASWAFKIVVGWLTGQVPLPWSSS